MNQRLTNSATKFKSSSNDQPNAIACDDSVLPSRLTETDWDLECDIAYSNYLQSILTKSVVSELKKKNQQAFDDQLFMQNELLQKSEYEHNKLIDGINDTEMQIKIRRLFIKLKQTFLELNEILKDYNMEKRLKVYNDQMESVCTASYLKDVKLIKTQEECEKLSVLLEICTHAMRKLKLLIGNMETVNVYGEQLKIIEQLQEELRVKRIDCFKLHAKVGLLVFKNISDSFKELVK